MAQASYNGNGNGSAKSYVSQGLVTQQEASMFSPEQLEFLARKRSTSPAPRNGSGSAARVPVAAGAAAASASADVQQAVRQGLVSQQEASSFSAEQLDFLIRKRRGF